MAAPGIAPSVKNDKPRTKGEVLLLFERGLTQLGTIRRCLDQCTKYDPPTCELGECPSHINNVIVGPQAAKIVFDAYRHTAPELNGLVTNIMDHVAKVKNAIELTKKHPNYIETYGDAIRIVDETTKLYITAIEYIKTHPLAPVKGGSRKRTHRKRKHHKRRTQRKHRK
jgi:hypothetical protein